jgi:hypothetical protein
MNEVDINALSLANEADAALAQLAPVDSVQDGLQQAVIAESWKPTIDSLMPMIRVMLVPQWELQDAEVEEFSGALVQCLDQVFPGGMSGKYACWVRLIFATGGIVATRYVIHGKLPPFGPKIADDADSKPANANTNTAKK